MGPDKEAVERAGGDLVCRFAGDIAVVRIRGRLDLDLARAFLEFLEKDLREKPSRIVLSCEEVEYVSSAGVSLLIRLSSEHRLRIAAPRKEILGILDTVGIRSLLSIHETEEAAVQAFVSEP